MLYGLDPEDTKMWECPKCMNLIAAEYGETEISCPECGTDMECTEEGDE